MEGNDTQNLPARGINSGVFASLAIRVNFVIFDGLLRLEFQLELDSPEYEEPPMRAELFNNFIISVGDTIMDAARKVTGSVVSPSPRKAYAAIVS